MRRPPLFEIRGRRVFVAGHSGMIGSAIVRRLAGTGCQILVAEHQALDLTDQGATERWFAENEPEAVFLAAGRVGGIHANQTFPADFISDNLAIAINVVRAAHRFGVKKLLALGSSCIYPKLARQPMMESALLTGSLEPSNEWYAIAKIAAIKLCEAYRRQHGCDFISVMPTNLYGRNDNYHPLNSHVPAALIRRFHEAKTTDAPMVTVWGSGTPRREFLYADDAADACIFAMQYYSGMEFLNIGTGIDITIREFAELVREVVGFDGEIVFDKSRPDGTPRKLLDVSKMSELGWTASTRLRDGLVQAYADFVETASRNAAHVSPDRSGCQVCSAL